MMVDRKDHRGNTSCLIYTMCPLLHTIQMTIECIVLAKAGDEVGDGPNREDDLFGCGCTLVETRCAASRGLSAATASIPPEHIQERLQEQSQYSADSVVTRCISAPHVPSLRLPPSFVGDHMLQFHINT